MNDTLFSFDADDNMIDPHPRRKYPNLRNPAVAMRYRTKFTREHNSKTRKYNAKQRRALYENRF